MSAHPTRTHARASRPLARGASVALLALAPLIAGCGSSDSGPSAGGASTSSTAAQPATTSTTPPSTASPSTGSSSTGAASGTQKLAFAVDKSGIDGLKGRVVQRGTTAVLVMTNKTDIVRDLEVRGPLDTIQTSHQNVKPGQTASVTVDFDRTGPWVIRAVGHRVGQEVVADATVFVPGPARA